MTRSRTLARAGLIVTAAFLLSRVLGFSEAEIRATFPEELARLAGGLGTDVDGAVAQLAHLVKVAKEKVRAADKRVKKKDVKILKIYQLHN